MGEREIHASLGPSTIQKVRKPKGKPLEAAEEQEAFSWNLRKVGFSEKGNNRPSDLLLTDQAR